MSNTHCIIKPITSLLGVCKSTHCDTCEYIQCVDIGEVGVCIADANELARCDLTQNYQNYLCVQNVLLNQCPDLVFKIKRMCYLVELKVKIKEKHVFQNVLRAFRKAVKQLTSPCADTLSKACCGDAKTVQRVVVFESGVNIPEKLNNLLKPETSLKLKCGRYQSYTLISFK
ncbi:hypothetical protein QPL79_09095 [Ignisphaera sp. 4213-co]|uniref:Uncharacterized protein n=1 Tax=Ignisphaera cupida TaxID=3050454 RepID=A0ABD4Z9C2_9CREN|nr:hypothetical protein [Ignisphaera sp. 4213-co]MDK6029518.1 hypothetical protein [Ignisphaera sp. 4213-co]